MQQKQCRKVARPLPSPNSWVLQHEAQERYNASTGKLLPACFRTVRKTMQIAFVLWNSFLTPFGVHDFILSTQSPQALCWQKLFSKLAQLEDLHSSWFLGYQILVQIHLNAPVPFTFSFLFIFPHSVGKVQGGWTILTCMAVCKMFLYDWSPLKPSRAANTGCCSNVTHPVWIPGLNIFTFSELAVLCTP